MQFAMAIAIADNRFGLAQATDEKVNHPLVKDLMRRVALTVYPDWNEQKDTQDNRPDRVTVTLKDGRTYSREVLVAKGTPRTPLTDDELLDKYRECAKLVLSDVATEQCAELVWKLEKLEHVSELMRILSG